MRLSGEVSCEVQSDRPLLSKDTPRCGYSNSLASVEKTTSLPHTPYVLPHRNCCIIDPNDSVILNVWDIFVAVLLVATAIIAPFESAFLRPKVDVLLFFDCAVDIVFVLDLVLQFFIAYADPVHPERLVKDTRRVVKRYLATWFSVDLISALPVDVCRVLAFAAPGSIAWSSWIQHLRFIRLLRLLRLTRAARLFARWHMSFGFSYANISLAKFLAAVLLCCHWMACLWGAIAMGQDQSEHKSWLTALQEAKGGPAELYDGAFQVYSISLYWAIITITSIGYGDITPQTTTEYWLASLCTAIMASIWAYVIGAVCGIVSTMHPHEVAFKRTMDDLNWLMCDRCMPYEMCKTLRRYFHERRDMNRQHAEQDLIAQMSPKLQGEYAHFMHKRWIGKVWYLRNMHYEIIVWASRHLSMAVFAPHEEVMTERTLFIVQRGLCAFKGKVLVSGDIWGEDMLLSNDFLRDEEKARSLGYLSVLMLHVLDLVDIVANFPEARARLRWAQVQIALMRGVQRIAQATRELEVTRGLRSEDLSQEQRMELFADILQGKFAHKDIPEDYLGVDVRSGGKLKPKQTVLTSRHSSYSASFSVASSCAEKDLDLTAAVGNLSQQLQDLHTKVDSLSCGQHNKPGSCGAAQRASQLADFGPVVRHLGSTISQNSSLLSPRAPGSPLRRSPMYQRQASKQLLPGAPSYARCMLPYCKQQSRENSGRQNRGLPTLLV